MSKKYNTEWFINKYKDVINTNIEIVGNYISMHDSILCKCKLCGELYNTSPMSLVQGCGCQSCSLIETANKRRLNIDIIKSRLKYINKDIEIVDGIYKDQKSKLECLCLICGHRWLASSNKLLQGRGCPKCAGNYRRSHNEFISEMKIINDNIEILGEYINISTKIKVRCKKCGKQWSVFPDSILRGHGCKACSNPQGSTGEDKILEYLKVHDFYVIRQKEFDGLIGLGNGNLSYDFYLPYYNLLIEYQGEFHDGTARLQTKKKYIKQQEHDKRKREYAEKHDIKLLEIWYWDFNKIEEILSREVNASLF